MIRRRNGKQRIPGAKQYCPVTFHRSGWLTNGADAFHYVDEERGLYVNWESPGGIWFQDHTQQQGFHVVALGCAFGFTIVARDHAHRAGRF